MRSARRPRAHRLPLSGVLRVNRPSEIWFKPALSVVVATAPPSLTLLALDRLDLAMYTMAGSLYALYAHHRPYAARALTLARVVLGMVAGLAVALVTASLTTNAVALVTVGALLAAAQKALCDASRIGPPANVVLTFVTSAALFVPQSLAQVPGHLAATAVAGAWAWLVCMAPGLPRPYGPERRATAQALHAVAAHVEEPERPGSRAAAAAAVHTAWQTLLAAGPRTEPRRALAALLVRADTALAAPAEAHPARLRALAGDAHAVAHRRRAAAPTGAADVPRDAADVPRDAERPADTGRRRSSWTARPSWTPRALLTPVAVRTALGCALAGYASLALGVGRPYWALVTAASLYQANLTLTWSRGVQRVVGNLVGVLAFAALVPLAHLGPAALVLCCLALAFGAEALISRNYWLGTVCVTPMALLVTEFVRLADPGELITDRLLDTLVGALVGFLAAVVVMDRRAGDRVAHALAAVERAHAQTLRTAGDPDAAPGALPTARRALSAALVELRAVTDTASGEWWQRALPTERVTHVERAGHRTLAATVRQHGFQAAEGARA
ncbi:FUSC family protein [Streptomyces caniscabiei]|uniref:FUSC family protein n=5 Tax=Streptomyces caniscabiei TaxID=2746961 RepID=A0ABU4MXI8_9ACTN|nr:FUSC family protein [Streptomyces caniscabiei]MDX2946680.1 FUSC family protein [Streptomyces caniscabiei]MDX2956133.1 FUSC family protein [Streptomyces caniscabiei]MDX2990004.1 FUSC family protein [Streptomyces caniscabiei]MDX3014227.1 FUSC family protein [Streptomyces caniscabiei]MDX3040888.1 FUSC family protein [Streptomyces caniscabiei]